MADASGFWSALNGLVEAEVKYVRRLAILKTIYKDPMVCARHIEPEQAKVLFSELEAIQLTHGELLQQMQAAAADPHDPPGAIARVLRLMSQFLRVTIPYVNNFSNASELLRKLRRQSVTEYVPTRCTLATFLQQVEYTAESDGLDLNSLLILPVQQIPRYQLHMAQLLKNMAPNTAEHEQMKMAERSLSHICAEVDAQKAQAEHMLELDSLRRHMTGLQHELITPSRRLVHTGELAVWFEELNRSGVMRLKTSGSRHPFLWSCILQYLGACRQQTQGTRVDRQGPKDASHPRPFRCYPSSRSSPSAFADGVPHKVAKNRRRNLFFVLLSDMLIVTKRKSNEQEMSVLDVSFTNQIQACTAIDDEIIGHNAIIIWPITI